MDRKQVAVLVGVFSALMVLGSVLALLFSKDCCGIRTRCGCGCKSEA